MKAGRYFGRMGIVLSFWMLGILMFNGCSMNSGVSSPQNGSADAPQQSDTRAPEKPTTVYHDFEDVLVPVELTVVKDKTMIISTPGYRSGILTLKGRVDSNSLYNFFSSAMDKDNWQVFSRIKTPEKMIMVYQKTTKCAVITINDQQIYTYVEISVAPRLGGGGGSITTSQNLTY